MNAVMDDGPLLDIYGYTAGVEAIGNNIVIVIGFTKTPRGEALASKTVNEWVKAGVVS